MMSLVIKKNSNSRIQNILMQYFHFILLYLDHNFKMIGSTTWSSKYIDIIVLLNSGELAFVAGIQSRNH